MNLCTIKNTILPEKKDYYHEVDRGSDTLVITVGDSWTWGDSLGKTTADFDDQVHRTSHVYGAIISKKLSSDFINLGFPGFNNAYILNTFKKTYSNLTKTYKNCHVFITLTESGRELNDSFIKQKDHYNYLRGKDWPTYDSILTKTASAESISFARNEMIEHGIEFVDHFGLMLELVKSISVEDFFIRYEQWTFNKISEIFNNFPEIKFYIARNFTSVCEQNSILLPGNLITKRWVDVIAEQGNLTPYPDRVQVLSGNGLTPIIETSKSLGLDKHKEEWIDVFTQSELAIDWLHNSPYNSKRATKHPLEQAHAWWAEYLLGIIK
jgi:hypothetical protein